MTRRAAFSGAPAASVWIALLAIYFVWGTTYLGIRVAVEAVPPFLLSGGRYGAAGALLLIWAAASTPGHRMPGVRQWLGGAATGALMIGVGNGVLCWAEQWLASGLAALTYIAPIWIALFGRLLVGDRVAPRAVIGFVVGFAGLALLIGPGIRGGSPPVTLVATVLASAGWALGSVLSRRVTLPSSAIQIAGLQMFCGGAASLTVGVLLGEPARFHVAQLALRHWAALAWLLLFGAVVGFAIYAWLIQAAPLPVVATYGYVNPMVAFVLGGLLLGEPFTALRVAGAAVVVLGVALVVTAQSGRRPPDPVPEAT